MLLRPATSPAPLPHSVGSTDPAYTTRREYSVALRTAEKEEQIVRYECCPTKEALRKLLRRDNPEEMVLKLDIGPVYNADVRLNKTGANFHPEEKELVFDIDMDEYDDVRTCCKGKRVCNQCFRFLTGAAKVIERGTPRRRALSVPFLPLFGLTLTPMSVPAASDHVGLYSLLPPSPPLLPTRCLCSPPPGLWLQTPPLRLFRSPWYPLLGLRSPRFVCHRSPSIVPLC